MRLPLTLGSRSRRLGLLVPGLLLLGACGLLGSEGGSGNAQPMTDGNPLADMKTGFQVSISQPTVVTLTPTGDALAVDPGALIEVAFNVDMEGTSAQDAITVTSAGSVITGTASYDAPSRRLTFQPARPLPANSVIVVTLADTVAADGQSCPGTQWTFTTSH